jgi:hypothetical protein
MTWRSKRSMIAGLILVMCTGAVVAVLCGVFRADEFGDQYATIGVMYENPLTLIPSPCAASNPHYIRVGGTTYKYHQGWPPGYLVAPKVNWMMFETTAGWSGGPRTLHIRDLATGTTTDIDEGQAALDMMRCATGLAPPTGRWWVHKAAIGRATFGWYERLEDGAYLELATIDLDRRTLEVRVFLYDANGNTRESPGQPGKPTPPGLSAAELIGDHRAEAGLEPALPKN